MSAQEIKPLILTFTEREVIETEHSLEIPVNVLQYLLSLRNNMANEIYYRMDKMLEQFGSIENIFAEKNEAGTAIEIGNPTSIGGTKVYFQYTNNLLTLENLSLRLSSLPYLIENDRTHINNPVAIYANLPKDISAIQFLQQNKDKINFQKYPSFKVDITKTYPNFFSQQKPIFDYKLEFNINIEVLNTNLVSPIETSSDNYPDLLKQFRKNITDRI
jgi:hypothetical protein